jgi:hypothetical protein
MGSPGSRWMALMDALLNMVLEGLSQRQTQASILEPLIPTGSE